MQAVRGSSPARLRIRVAAARERPPVEWMLVPPRDLLLAHVCATWALVGLIWIVQVVQYPGFADVGPREFAAFHERHCARIGSLVAPLMLCEAATGIALLAAPPTGMTSALWWSGACLLALPWLATASIAVPLHRRLAAGDLAARRALVTTNWVRTAAWSLRGAWTIVVLRAAWAQA